MVQQHVAILATSIALSVAATFGSAQPAPEGSTVEPSGSIEAAEKAHSQAKTDVASPADLREELERIDGEIARAEGAADEYGDGAIGLLARWNEETLRLTRSLLEARIVAAEGGAPLEIGIPASRPDPDEAERLAAQIEEQEQAVADAEAEAGSAGGLIGNLAIMRVETEKVTLAQLRLAWVQAQFGVALPALPGSEATGSAGAVAEGDETATTDVQARDEPVEVGDSDAAASTGPAWADPDHPEIDYDTPAFKEFAEENAEISGWWAIVETRAEIDDSRTVIGVNLSNRPSGFTTSNPTIYGMCAEGRLFLVYDTDQYLLLDHNSSQVPVTLRVDSEDAREMTWGVLSGGEGVGLTGRSAEDMIRELQAASKLFMRLTERNGKRHDISVDLTGAEKVWVRLADACSFSLLALDEGDYKAIQTLLNAAGFDAGEPDGSWGPGSERAMRAFQEANDLPLTGAPDEATLARMGWTDGGE